MPFADFQTGRFGTPGRVRGPSRQIVPQPDAANHLDIDNGASTEKSLNFMFRVALIGMPCSIAHTVSSDDIFGGKAKHSDESC